MREKAISWLQTLSAGSLEGLLLTLPFWRHRVLFHRLPEVVFFEFHDIVLYANDPLWWTALSAWLLSRLVARVPSRLHLGPWFLAGPLAALLALGSLGIPTSVDPLYAGYQALRLFLLFALYLMLVNAPLPRGAIAWALAGGLTLQAIVALSQFALGRSLGLSHLGEIVVDAAWPGASVIMVGEERWLRAYGLTQHPNLLAGCLMAAMPVVASYYLEQRGFRRVLLLAALGLGFSALLLTFSRAAWLGTLLGGAIALVLLWQAWRRDLWAPNRSTIAMLVIVLLALSAAFLAVNWPLLRPRLGLIAQGTEIRSIEARKTQIPAARALIHMRPVLGVGLGNYATALYRLTRETVAAYPVYQPVYSVALLAAAELGILGGISWLSLATLPWLKLWLCRRQIRITSWWAGLSGALLSLTVVSFFDFYVWASHQGRLIWWVVLGLWAREWKAARRE